MRCQYDHLQFFVDGLKPLAHYKSIEQRLVAFAKLMPHATGQRDLVAGRKAWCEMGSAADPAAFQVHDRDLVEQLLYGFGWRITAEHSGSETRSLLLSTVDPAGVKFVITCKQVDEEDEEKVAGGVPVKRTRSSASSPSFDHFSASHLERFTAYHNGAQGVAVLGFEVGHGDLDGLLQRYRTLHPKLVLASPHEYGGDVRVLDVFAYYTGEKRVSEADAGTVIRFVERGSAAAADGSSHLPLPGLSPVTAEFDCCGVLPAYCDHWVSNVRSRVGFLQTLQETLGFTPKVDFNAGVVAAGEAQIESTVMGNASELLTSDPHQALVDRGQVFLPTNNALTPVGHVHCYLAELGQGIQHVASRVASLPEYVQRANDYRTITGGGFRFLDIPRTYYGLLERRLLEQGGTDEGELLGDCARGLGAAEAEEVIAALVRAGLSDAAGAVDLDADDAGLDATLLAHSSTYRAAGAAVRAMVCRVVARSRFVNLWRMMRDQLAEATYLAVVRNKILIDVQGEDVLMQIFTSVVLQREPGRQAPFLEFIQRVCAQCADGDGGCRPIRPGCGGFGIRNFLTLFLSIELSKATLDRDRAEGEGRLPEAAHHGRRLTLFTEQLVESNPILTEVSDCMTGEGRALEAADAAAAEEWGRRKEAANRKLQECSQKYNRTMKALREEGWAS